MLKVLHKNWITVADGADLVGCTPQYIRFLAKEQKIKSEKIGSVWLIDRKQLETLANKEVSVGRPRSRKKP
jgi:excisionase family DNA binding protein